MAKLPGLFERGGVFQLRVMIPKDLQAAYGGRSKLVQSLQTSDHRKAVLLGHSVRTDLLLGFEDMRRRQSPAPVAVVTPALSKLLADRIQARLLAADDTLRSNPEALELLHGLAVAPYSALTLPVGPQPPSSAPPAPVDPLAGLSAEQSAKLERLNDGLTLHASQSLARRNLRAALPLVQAEAHALGMSFDPLAPGARAALLQAVVSMREGAEMLKARDRGEVVVTPQLQPIPAASGHSAAAPAALDPSSLREVYRRWKASKARSEDTNRACLRALELFESQHPEAAGNVQSITRATGDSFRAWLLENSNTSKTARDRFNWLKTLLKYACRDLELIQRQPWEGLDLAFKTTSPRRPYTEEELQRLFGLPLFTRYELPTAWNAGADAAYWVPLLGLFLGARCGELCQLQTNDVDTSGSFPVLKIRDDGEVQQVKTGASIRDVPIHPELIRLGFMEYVEKIRRTAPEGPLWPSLPLRKGKPSGMFSNWFNETRRLPPVSFGPHPDFHCFRHTVRTQMTEAGITEAIQDRITGHTVKGSTGTKVYAHPVQALRRAVESVRYPCLDLPRCYR